MIDFNMMLQARKERILDHSLNLLHQQIRNRKNGLSAFVNKKLSHLTNKKVSQL